VNYFLMPFSSGSTRISNELGAGHAEAARLASYVSVSLAIMEAVLISGMLLLARNVLGMAYTNDPAVIHRISKMVPLLAGTTILDGIQGVLSGSTCS
jgi:MATE family multidrug resistance protein